MAQQDVEAIIKKAISDETFKLALSRDFDNAVKVHGLELTALEREALKSIDWSKKLPSNSDLLAATWVHIYKSDPTV